MTSTSKDMFNRIADAVETATPPPPQPVVDEAYVRAERPPRRRSRKVGGVVGAGLAVAAAGFGATALIDHGPPAAGPTRPPGPSTGAPEALRTRGAALLAALEEAVPDGYSVPRESEVKAGDGVTYPLRTVAWRPPAAAADRADPRRWSFLATLEVQRAGRALVLTLESIPRRSTANDPSDLCLAQPVVDGDLCTTRRASDGDPVRLAWSDDRTLGRTTSAARFHDGFVIRVGQAPRVRPGVAPLPTAVLTDQALTDLAADPRLARVVATGTDQ
jgi:hypothetical protein